ncbi:MAG TPA: phosphotransferase [Steroidobacteraceae bacterium]|nr:phosphotransferase [Steroidobacteraceae bacterium]
MTPVTAVGPMPANPSGPGWEQALSCVPGCGSAAPLEVQPLAGGSANATYRVRSPQGQFVVRLHEPFAAQLGVDRRREALLHAAAARAGLAPAILAADAAGHFLVTEHVDARTWERADLEDPRRLVLLARALRRLHALPAPQAPPFDLAALAAAHVEAIVRADPAAAGELEPLLSRAQGVLAELAAGGRRHCIVHNDLNHANLLGDGPLYLIDWEYAAVTDPISDLACLAAYYPQVRAHLPLLLAESALAATPGELQQAAWVYSLVSDLWYRRLQLAARDAAGTTGAAAGARHRQPADYAPLEVNHGVGMPLLRVVDRDGVEHQVEGRSGLKLMETLRDLDYGVAAICGGMCSCATCHVYVDPQWVDRLPPAQSDERELLADLAHYETNSRLSCQIPLTDALAGLRVTIAPDE